jgi:hypothetical protein
MRNGWPRWSSWPLVSAEKAGRRIKNAAKAPVGVAELPLPKEAAGKPAALENLRNSNLGL